MNLHISSYRYPPEIQFVERKGRGHPDTLADRLAERLSVAYCNLCQENFGAILRHQFDKLSLMGGKCHTTFGGGHFNSPIRVLVNGRISPGVGDNFMPFYDVAFGVIKEFLQEELVDFDFYSNARVMWEVTCHGTRGFVDPAQAIRSGINHRFRPRSLNDLPETTSPLSNDTAMGVAWEPLTSLEEAVLELETKLTSRNVEIAPDFLGTDCKIMGTTSSGRTFLTVSIPMLANSVSGRADYFEKLDAVRTYINSYVETRGDLGKVELTLNPGDHTDSECLYIRKTGSCIESGDEGQVGRGNRFGGLIAACRGYSIEAVNGKNPAYHAGKLYAAMAQDIACAIFHKYGTSNQVFIISQIDRPIIDPWQVSVSCAELLPRKEIKDIVQEVTNNPAQITRKFLDGYYRTC